MVAPIPEKLEIEGDDPAVALRRTLGMFADRSHRDHHPESPTRSMG